MNILVCISQVPDTASRISFSQESTHLNTDQLSFIINPYDEIALSKALALTEEHPGNVTVIHVGDPSTESTIRKALAIGAQEAVRIDAHPMDAWYVAKQIAHYAADKQFDLILTGRESIDYNGSQVAGFLGELLNIPSIAIAKKITLSGDRVEVEREIEGGIERLSALLPLVIGIAEGVAESRIPNMRGIMSARTKPLTVLEPVEVTPFSNIIRYDTPPPREQLVLIDASNPGELIDYLHARTQLL